MAAGVIHVSKRDIGASRVAEVGLKPHRLERYLASDDPDFESKAADVIGLYLNPPQHAAVFCVDEKSAIQALDRLDQCCRCLRASPSCLGSPLRSPPGTPYTAM